jgi:6-phospho-beta-glucosidase
MASLHASTGDVQVVDVANNGAIPELANDAVVEVPATIDSDGAHPLAQRPLDQHMVGLVSHAKAYERLAVEAALSGSMESATLALLANPLVGQYDQARALVEAIVKENERYLPRFARR